MRISDNNKYGPFGEVIRATGPLAKVNPIRFSTKYQDDESDLLYYGYRYYKASTGTWLCRDKIGEKGGPNLFHFLGNDPVDQVDKYGNASFTPKWVGNGVSAKIDKDGVGNLWAGLALWPVDPFKKGHVIVNIAVTFNWIYPCNATCAENGRTIAPVNFSFLTLFSKNQFDKTYNPTPSDGAIFKFANGENAMYYVPMNTDYPYRNHKYNLNGTFGKATIDFAYDFDQDNGDYAEPGFHEFTDTSLDSHAEPASNDFPVVAAFSSKNQSGCVMHMLHINVYSHHVIVNQAQFFLHVIVPSKRVETPQRIVLCAILGTIPCVFC